MTRQCAKALEATEYSILNLVEAQNQTVASYSILMYHLLSHVYDLVDGCSSSFTHELSEKKTYVAFGNETETIGTVNYWLA